MLKLSDIPRLFWRGWFLNIKRSLKKMLRNLTTYVRLELQVLFIERGDQVWREIENEGMGPRIGKGGCVMGKREVGWDPRDQEGKENGKTGSLETRKGWWMEMGRQEPGRGSRMNTRITDSEP